MEKIKRSVAMSLIFALILTLISMNFGFADQVVSEDLTPTTVSVKSTYPKNNAEWVEVNPLIRFDFKEPVELVKNSKLEDSITITSDGGKFAVDLNKDAFLSFEGNSLKIDVNSLDRSGKFTLRKNTAYRVTIKEGALRVKGRKDKLGKDILNEKEELYFITGDKKISANEGLVVKQYSSNKSMSDDITLVHNTQLDSNGEIFIHFNKKIQWNKYKTEVKTDNEALKYFKLYKKPHAYKKNADLTDQSYMYDILKQPVPSNLEKVDIESVQILKNSSGENTNILKIKPVKPFLNLNEYQIVLDKKEMLISFEDDTLRDPINQSIWTKPTNDRIAPLWDRDSLAEEIVEDKNAPNKDYNIDNYVIYGAPNYGPLNTNDTENSKPITILVDKEVRLKPYTEGYMSPLEFVNLEESYKQSNTKVEIENYKIEYYFDVIDGTKKTKLLFYPKTKLESGKEYTFKVPNGTFVSRGNVDLRGISLRFGIEGAYTRPTGIYKAIVNVDGSYKNESVNVLFDDYFYKDINGNFKKKLNLKLKGYNFTEDIVSVNLRKIEEFQPRNDEERNAYRSKVISQGVQAEEFISIPTSDVIFHTVNDIEINLQSSILEKLSKTRSLGTYSVEIVFKNKDGSKKTVTSLINEKLSLIKSIMSPCQGHPEPIFWTPYTDQTGVNHKNLDRVVICFDDPDGDLVEKANVGGFVDPYRAQEFKIMDPTNTINLRDKSKDITISKPNGKICFTIPINKSLTTDGMTYKVTIPRNILRCKFGDDGPHPNLEKTWEFTTTPIGKAEQVFEGSVPEDYNPDYPIVLYGKDLSSNTKVFFKHLGTDKEYPVERHPLYLPDDPSNPYGIGAKGKLFVYLPTIRRLPVGLYNVVLKTDTNLEHEYIYGTFSVVKKGAYVPNETDKDKDSTDDDVENIKEIIATSKNEMELKSSYRGRLLNLDGIIGDDVLTREIKFKGEKLPLLDLESKWSNVKLTDVKKLSPSSDMKIRVGRAEPHIQDIFKKKLKGYNVKSDFVIVGGENYIAKKLNLTIPYKNSSGKNLKVMKYDEETRRVYEVDLPESKINTFDKLISLEANSVLENSKNTNGVFVVVE